MKAGGSSPRITHISWGRIEVEGAGRFKDAKVYPGGAMEWDWRQTGTEHHPGIQPSDVEDLIDRGACRVVLSTGMHGRLEIDPRAMRLLEGKGIPADVLPTEEAVRLYNSLCGSEPIGGLFHSTC